MKIDPDRLRSLRKKKSLTRPALAKRSGISERTIQRLENEPNQSNKTQEHTLNELARALGVEQGVLTGEVPLPEYKNTPPSDPERVQIGAQVAPKTRLAYDLIKRRYGVSATEIINMAPLFFALLAEGSLAWRREKLQEAEEVIDRLYEVKKDTVHMDFYEVVTPWGELYSIEDNSVKKADIFGEDLLGNDVPSGFDPFDPTIDNPFASYLRKLAKDLDNPSIVNLDKHDLFSGILRKFPRYKILEDEIDRIANNSAEAKRALASGYLRLSDIPNELMAEEMGEKRAKWIENKSRGDEALALAILFDS